MTDDAVIWRCPCCGENLHWRLLDSGRLIKVRERDGGLHPDDYAADEARRRFLLRLMLERQEREQLTTADYWQEIKVHRGVGHLSDESLAAVWSEDAPECDSDAAPGQGKVIPLPRRERPSEPPYKPASGQTRTHVPGIPWD